jgi:hypothetical protein
MCKKTGLFFFFAMLLSQLILAQKNLPIHKVDSASFYRGIEKYAKKRKATKYVYELIFNPIDVPKSKKHKDKLKVRKQKTYSRYQGRIISRIRIQTLDPFGYNAADSTITPQGKLNNAGNSLHKKTLNITIRNLLLVKRNQPFDSLLVKESERLIRAQKYVREVAVFVEPIGKDSVEILYRVLDAWSIIPEGSLSGSSLSIGGVDNNLSGFGHELHVNYDYYFSQGKSAIQTNYIIPNIRNSYISSDIKYAINGDNSFIKSVDTERPFYSPFAKWAGGALVSQQLIKDSIRLSQDSKRILQDFKFNSQDFWLAKAWRIFKSQSEDDRTTNLILSGRYYNIKYLTAPSLSYDSLRIYSNSNLYIMGLGVSTRKYVQDKYVFKYGFVEDVPIGKSYGIVAGIQHKLVSRAYIGAKASFGNYYEWGYLSTDIEYGTFIHSSSFQEGVFTTSFNYFTPLYEFGKWKLRQFIKPLIVIGINRLATDKVTINNEFGIRGFSSDALIGMHKIVLTFQTQTYSPWRLMGFSFGPYFSASFGILGNELSGFRRSKVYSQLGVGVLLKNDFLIFNAFQLSFAYYPTIPNQGSNIFKLNPYSTTDFGFRDFQLAKPDLVKYQ